MRDPIPCEYPWLQVWTQPAAVARCRRALSPAEYPDAADPLMHIVTGARMRVAVAIIESIADAS
jgi:hypothetical protein